MSVYKNKEWIQVDKALRHVDGLQGITSKIIIGDHALYVKTAWFAGKIVHIDITISREKGDEGPVSVGLASAEATNYDLARSWVETSCRMASTMLQMGEAEIEDIAEEWKGVSGFPKGYCMQLLATNPETGEIGPTFQPSPLSAAAMLIMRRKDDWAKRLDVLTNDERR